MTAATCTATFFIAALTLLTLSTAQEVLQDQHEPQFSGVPVLATFATYEEMQRYFAHRNLRSLRFIQNPTDDSYISAFNQHNEQPAIRRKRATGTNNARKLPTTPMLLKFEISDAVEPSDALKAIIREHRGRELRQTGSTIKTQSSTTTATPTTTKFVPQSKTKVKLARRIPKSRTKRATVMRTAQPQQFQVQLIPFEVADAREPDEQTRKLIKRMRALELEQFKRGQQTLKRTRRAAPKTPPQMIKFELEDAKAPQESLQAYIQHQQQQRARASKQLSISRNDTVDMEAEDEEREDDQSSHESKRMFVYKEAPHIKTKKSINSLPHGVQKVITHLLKEQNGGGGGGGGGDNAKAYVKYIPAQQVDYGSLKAAYGAKLPAHSYGDGGGGLKLSNTPAISYVKYVQPLQKSQQVQVQIHPVPVVEKVRYVYTPVAAAPAHIPQAHISPPQQQQKYAQAAILEPIVVTESAPRLAQQASSHQVQQGPAEVHHTYMADLSNVHDADDGGQVIKGVPAPNFRPSKPDPMHYNAASVAAQYAKPQANYAPIEHYKYEVFTQQQHEYAAPAQQQQQQHDYAASMQQQQQHQYAAPAQSAPVIKIEYVAPHDLIQNNYKEMQEFKELSALVGKSPEDQIHGLTYLLAKEMQSKLQVQREQKQSAAAEAARPQDNTSPILFHPENQHVVQHSAAMGAERATVNLERSGLIGMGKSQDYIPIVEKSVEAAAPEQQHAPAPAAAPVEQAVPKTPAPTSFVEYGQDHSYGHGLSQNYEGAALGKDSGARRQEDFIIEKVVHHPTVTHHGSLGMDSAAVKHNQIANSHGASGKNSLEHGGDSDSVKHMEFDKEYHGLQYASKYAFGYRIRDFHTGNDFGHKQNRDMDGVTRGQYHILLPDGRIQNVIYHADDTGFHADVSFETGH